MKLEPGYILGFVEGEGTFNLVRYPEGRIRPQFLVFNTNREILESIKETLKVNAPIFEVSRVEDLIKRTKNTYRLQVRSKEDLVKVVRFFEKRRPIVKRDDYKIFKDCFDNWITKR